MNQDQRRQKKDSSHEFTVEDARDTLDRIIGFISNCDTKASVVLGVLGVILTILITDSTISKLYSIVKTAADSGTFLSILFLILLINALGVLAFGIIKLITVLIAKTGPSNFDSNIYFADIASNKDCENYKIKVFNQSKNNMINDLINQIYINSKICDKKFKRYNFGLALIFIGTVLFVIFFIIGVLSYIPRGNMNG